jgi:enamine deaminase RidA (YjgF/YER057c/UK114 family)
MNEAYAKFLGAKPPARSTVQGSRWPEGSLLVIEAIARVAMKVAKRQPPGLGDPGVMR